MSNYVFYYTKQKYTDTISESSQLSRLTFVETEQWTIK